MPAMLLHSLVLGGYIISADVLACQIMRGFCIEIDQVVRRVCEKYGNYRDAQKPL